MFTWLAVLVLVGGVAAAVRRVLAAGRTPLDGRRRRASGHGDECER